VVKIRKKKKKIGKISRFLEELNQFFNRPLAFGAVKLFHRLKIAPNVVTFFSMACGISSGFFFAKGDSHGLTAAILLELMIILDCSDGQLARMLKKSSSFGKTLDGLADFGTHISIFYGVAFALYVKSGSIIPFFLAVLAQLSMYLHIILYDHFKNVFIDVTKPDYIDRLENLKELEARLEAERKAYARFSLKWFISRLYYIFYRIENWAVAIGYSTYLNNFYDLFPYPDRIDPYIREVYYQKMRFPVKLWSFIGDTTHLTLFVVFGIIRELWLIFPSIILGTNLIMVFALIVQRIKFKNLGLERELLWQERFD